MLSVSNENDHLVHTVTFTPLYYGDMVKSALNFDLADRTESLKVQYARISHQRNSHSRFKVRRSAQSAAFLHTAPLTLIVFHKVELFLI